MKIHHFAVIGTALCQTFVALADEPIDQIVVSGSRTPLSISQLGSSVSIIDRNAIEQRQARTVAELLRSVPGFAVSHTGVSGSQTQVRVRGAEANHILVLIDGVRANDPATGDEFRWEYLSTGNIERIEIVRGPQSSIWGSDAVSAVVHIITRNGESGDRIDGFVEGGSFGTTNAGLNGQISSDTWSLTASVERHDTDGDNISRSGDEKDDADLLTAALGAEFRAGDAVTISTGLRVVDAHSQFDAVDFTTGLPADSDTATDASNLYTYLNTDITTNKIGHTLAVRYFDSDNVNLSGGVENSSGSSDRLTLLYQANFSLGDNRASIGLEREETGFEQRGTASPFGDPNQDQTLDTTSLVAEYQGLSHAVNWVVSARFDSNSDFDDALNGRLAISYPLTDASVLRASVATGRKNPTFVERFGFFADQFIGNAALKPETSVSWELGLRQDLGDGAATLDIAAFYQTLEDEINGFVFDPNTFLFTAENMAGESERQGVEASLDWPLSDSFSLNAHYTYTDATQPGSNSDVRELRRPRHAGGLGASFVTQDQRFSATLNADFGGERTDQFFPPFPTPSEIVTLDSYWLVDLTVQYRASDTVTIFAKGSNLLDEDYEQVFGYRTLGRGGSLGLRVNFGQ